MLLCGSPNSQVPVSLLPTSRTESPPCTPLQRYSKSSSKAVIPFPLSSRMWGFPLLHSLPNTYIISLFHFIHLVWNGVLLWSQLGVRLSSFIYVCSPLVLPFCAMMVSFACFSNGHFLLELEEFLSIQIPVLCHYVYCLQQFLCKYISLYFDLWKLIAPTWESRLSFN